MQLGGTYLLLGQVLRVSLSEHSGCIWVIICHIMLALNACSGLDVRLVVQVSACILPGETGCSAPDCPCGR